MTQTLEIDNICYKFPCIKLNAVILRTSNNNEMYFAILTMDFSVASSYVRTISFNATIKDCPIDSYPMSDTQHSCTTSNDQV